MEFANNMLHIHDIMMYVYEVVSRDSKVQFISMNARKLERQLLTPFSAYLDIRTSLTKYSDETNYNIEIANPP